MVIGRFCPRLQRRVRDGFTPSFLASEYRSKFYPSISEAGDKSIQFHLITAGLNKNSAIEERGHILNIFRFYFMTLLRIFDGQIMAHVLHGIQGVVGEERWNDVVIFPVYTEDCGFLIGWAAGFWQFRQKTADRCDLVNGVPAEQGIDQRSRGSL